LEPFLNSLELVDLNSNKDSKLVLLGDYINRGKESCQVLYKIKELEDKYTNQVVVLAGNHDQDFIDWITEFDLVNWFHQDPTLDTVKSFFNEDQLKNIFKEVARLGDSYIEMNDLLRGEIVKEHSALIDWLTAKRESLYYETENQIFVHAGISEADGDMWKYLTEQREFTCKYPAETGYFYKDIIAGHVSSIGVSGDETYLGKVFWDGDSHYYIDGETPRSKTVAILKYETNTKVYSSYELTVNGDWVEYKITKSQAK